MCNGGGRGRPLRDTIQRWNAIRPTGRSPINHLTAKPVTAFLSLARASNGSSASSSARITRSCPCLSTLPFEVIAASTTTQHWRVLHYISTSFFYHPDGLFTRACTSKVGEHGSEPNISVSSSTATGCLHAQKSPDLGMYASLSSALSST
jgi:hypothetical protein